MLLADDIELVAGDPALPGLATVLDDEAVRDALQERLPMPSVEFVRGVAARYRPGERCIVKYKLGAAGKKFDGYAAAYAPEYFPRAAASASGVVADDVAGDPALAVSLPEMSVIARVFPNDPGLPVLPQLNDRSGRKQLLARLVPEHPRLRDGDVSTLRYNPEHKFTGRVTAGARSVALIKAYREPFYSRATAAASTLCSSGSLKLPRLIGRSDDDKLLAFDWLPGRPLGEILRDTGPDPELFYSAGTALAQLHARPALDLSHSRARARQSLTKRAAWIAKVDGEVGELAGLLAAKIRREALEEGSWACTVHGDFYPDQVLVGNGSVAIIDLDDCARGEPAVDLGSFLAYLDRRALTGAIAKQRLANAMDQVLEGYATRAGHNPARSRLLSHMAADMFARATSAFRRRQPGWRESLRLLLIRAEELLDAR
jgi:aminoglycoside phosphotransferase (APT) family kinase protein